jgi:hypothetical protein
VLSRRKDLARLHLHNVLLIEAALITMQNTKSVFQKNQAQFRP